jgi:hypothetical protein
LPNAPTAHASRSRSSTIPIPEFRWRGRILDGALYIREAKGPNRDAVVAQLLRGP